MFIKVAFQQLRFILRARDVDVLTLFYLSVFVSTLSRQFDCQLHQLLQTTENYFLKFLDLHREKILDFLETKIQKNGYKAILNFCFFFNFWVINKNHCSGQEVVRNCHQT